jgi:hypothetical protein
MIFSQWQSHGGYKYFETDAHHPIGDDTPDVAMPAESGGIGVPAQDVGYPIPRDAEFVGEGDTPVGIMAPMARSGYRSLGQTDTKLSQDQIVVVLALIAALGAAAYASRK